MLIADVIVGQWKLAQLGHFSDMAKGIACDLVASNIKTLQLLKFDDIWHPIVGDLVMVYEQFPQLLETIANRIKTKIRKTIFSEDQSLDTVEVLDCLDILIRDLSMR